MPKPRSRKPFSIPSVPPVVPVGADAAPRGGVSTTSLPARVLVRAGALLRPRGDRRVVHRRLVDPGAGVPVSSTRASGNVDAGQARPLRGATARFVALG